MAASYENNAKKELEQGIPGVKHETDCLLPIKSPSATFNDGSILGWFRNLRYQFGSRFLILIFIVHHVLRGIAVTWVLKGMPYLYRSYHVPATQMQIFPAIAGIPWSVKPVIALFSDLFPIFGFHKAPYMWFSTCAGAIALIIIGVMPQKRLVLPAVVACLFFKSLQMATCDLLIHAKCAEKIAQAPKYGPDLTAFLFMGMAIAGLISNLSAGPMIQTVGPKLPFLLAGIVGISALVPVSAGYMEEKRRTALEAQENRKQIYKQGEACFLCIVMLCSAVVLAISGALLYRDKLALCIVSVCVAVGTLLCYSIVLSPVFAQVNAFFFLTTILHFGTNGATFYFYTDTPEEYPDGPHFSKIYFVSVLGTAACVFHFLGVLSYQRFLRSWKYRNVMILTNILMGSMSALDILVFARINRKIGIPDRVCVLGLAILEDVFKEWQLLPMGVLLAHLCPKGMEAIMTALLQSSFNLGNIIQMNVGAFALERLHVVPRGKVNEGAQFDNLWIAAMISTILHVIAIFVLLPLVPNARQDEKLWLDEMPNATSGSFFRRYIWHDRKNCAD